MEWPIIEIALVSRNGHTAIVHMLGVELLEILSYLLWLGRMCRALRSCDGTRLTPTATKGRCYNGTPRVR